MRVAIIGAGGIGAPLGASLALAGHDVTFVARGAHLAAIRRDGLRITGDRGDSLVRPAQATDDAARIGPVDLVLFCVKLWDVESAGIAIRPLIGPETAVIPLQNGVDATERLQPVLNGGDARPDAVMGGVAVVTGAIVAPGVVRQSGTHHRITFGEIDGRITPRAERIGDACRGAGIEATVSADIQRARWEKFILLAASSAICTAARSCIGPLRADPAIWPLFDLAMAEVAAVGAAHGIRFGPDVLAPWRAFLHGVPDDWIPSMTQDLLAGRRLELPWLAGRAVALAMAKGVEVPVLRTLNAVLTPFAAGGSRSAAG